MFKKILSGGFWVVVRQFGSRGIGLGVFYLISTFVGPEELGLLGMAWLLVAIAEGVFGLGMPLAVLRSPKFLKSDADTLFISMQLQGVAIAALILLGAPFLGRAMESEVLVEMVQVLSLIFILRAFSSVPVIFLTREMELKKLALLEILSVGVGGGVGVWLASEGYGAWSLVWRHIVSAFVTAIVSLLLVAWRPRFIFSKRCAWELLKFGAPVCFSLNIAWLVGFQFQQAMIGSILGLSALGIFSFGKKPFDVLGQIITAVCSTAIMPLLVKKRARFMTRRGLCSAMHILTTMTVVSACLSLWGGGVIIEHLNLDANVWREAFALMPVLGAASCVTAVGLVARTYLLVLGCSKLISIVSVLQAVSGVGLIWVAVGHGLIWVSYSVLCTAIVGTSLFLGGVYWNAIRVSGNSVMPCGELEGAAS